MIRAEQVPQDAWVELALRLESCGVTVTEQQARLAAVALLNAWPRAMVISYAHLGECDWLRLPLPQEPRDE